MNDEYLEYVLSELRNRTGIDFSVGLNLELIPMPLQIKIRRATQMLKTLHSLKNMINATDKKGIFRFDRSKRVKEAEEYRFEYEKLEKDYLALLDEIAKELTDNM